MIKYIDLFSGLGGTSIALNNLHLFKCVFASEIDEKVKKIYSENFNHNLHGDITKIHAKDIPQHDVLVACPPCQSFSIAGRRLGFKDPRGLLFLEIFRIAKYHKPRIIFAENVPHVLKVQNGEVIERIKAEFKMLGYRLFIHKLTASDYGVPQARQRVYFVGIRSDLDLISYEPAKFKNASCVQDYLLPDSEVEEKLFRNQHKFCLDLSRLDNKFNQRKPLLLGNFSGTTDQTSRIFSTLAAAATHIRVNANRTLYYTIEENIRKLTVIEIKKIMGFDGYKIPDENKYKKYLGNAIIPALVELIFKNIK